MAKLLQRAIAYLFVGSILLMGPFLVALVVIGTIRNAIFIHTSVATSGTILEMRPVRTSRNGYSYAPVFRYMADDGETYIIVPKNSSSRTSFAVGQQVKVLYQHGHPESAKIDSLFQLWAFEMIGGVVGGTFCILPGMVIVRRLRGAAAS